MKDLLKDLLKSKTAAVIVLFLSLLGLFLQPPDTKKESSTITSSSFTLTESQYDELGTAYACVLSDKYSSFFTGCNFTSNGKYLLVEVNSRWLYLHKEDKIAFVKDVGSLYMGMLGARGFKLNPEDLQILVRHNGSGNKLATWDYIFGTEIKE